MRFMTEKTLNSVGVRRAKRCGWRQDGAGRQGFVGHHQNLELHPEDISEPPKVWKWVEMVFGLAGLGRRAWRARSRGSGTSGKLLYALFALNFPGFLASSSGWWRLLSLPVLKFQENNSKTLKVEHYLLCARLCQETQPSSSRHQRPIEGTQVSTERDIIQPLKKKKRREFWHLIQHGKTLKICWAKQVSHKRINTMWFPDVGSQGSQIYRYTIVE